MTNKIEWNKAIWLIGTSVIMLLGAIFGNSVDRIPMFVVANFISLGTIAYLYGASQ